MARIGWSRPDSGLGFPIKVLETFQLVPSLLTSGRSHSKFSTFGPVYRGTTLMRTPPPPWTLQQDYTWGRTVEGAIPYERGTPEKNGDLSLAPLWS